MTIHFDGIKINVKIQGDNDELSPILFVHGFSGSNEDWKNICSNIKNRKLICVDLPGHGNSEIPKETKYYKQDALVNLIEFIRYSLNLGKIILVGYSMGGRLALSYAVKFYNHLEKLVLESSSPGLLSDEEKEIRKKEDNRVADFIVENTIEDFINLWLSQDIFKSLQNLPPDKKNKLREAKLKNNRIGLANMLRGFGTGEMNSVWNELAKINCEVLMVAGELDSKYIKISKRIQDKIRKSKLKIIPGVGHNTHLENENEFLRVLESFIK